MQAAAFGPATRQSAAGSLYENYIPGARDPTRIYIRPGMTVPPEMEAVMFDIIFLAAGTGFFLASIAYTLLCERL